MECLNFRNANSSRDPAAEILNEKDFAHLPRSTDDQRLSVNTVLPRLNRIREAIYLSELTLKPILVDGKTDQATATLVHENLQSRLDDMELFCSYPLRFRSSEVFELRLFKFSMRPSWFSK